MSVTFEQVIKIIAEAFEYGHRKDLISICEVPDVGDYWASFERENNEPNCRCDIAYGWFQG